MNFVGYTYKADVEAEKSMLVNVLKELDSVSDQQFEPHEKSGLMAYQEQMGGGRAYAAAAARAGETSEGEAGVLPGQARNLDSQ